MYGVREKIQAYCTLFIQGKIHRQACFSLSLSFSFSVIVFWFINVMPKAFLRSCWLLNVTDFPLIQLVGSRGERQPSDTEVEAAIWEACGDSGALQLIVDLLNMK